MTCVNYKHNLYKVETVYDDYVKLVSLIYPRTIIYISLDIFNNLEKSELQTTLHQSAVYKNTTIFEIMSKECNLGKQTSTYFECQADKKGIVIPIHRCFDQDVVGIIYCNS